MIYVLFIVLMLIVTAVVVVIIAFNMRAKERSESLRVTTDSRDLYREGQTKLYSSQDEAFIAQLSAMWAEKYRLEHFVLDGFNDENGKNAHDTALRILSDGFGINDRAGFENKLQFYTSNAGEMDSFVQFIARQQSDDAKTDDDIVDAVMAQYQDSKKITQFYNLKDNTNEASRAYFALYHVSIAVLILRLSIYARFCSEDEFLRRVTQIYEKYHSQSIDWPEFYKHWLLAHLFYNDCSYHDPYSVDLRNNLERVNKLTFIEEQSSESLDA